MAARNNRSTETVTIGETQVRIRRSNRKSVAIRAADDGVCEILAPYFVSSEKLCEIASPHIDKIAADCEKIKKRNEARREFSLVYGELVRLFGEKRELRPTGEKQPHFDCVAFYVPEERSKRSFNEAVISAYKVIAKEYITKRVGELSDEMGLCPTSVKINSARSRLGSCSRIGGLNFSWLLIMANREAVDYVIIHELCHMRHFNHSAAFWSEVEKYSLDCKAQKAYLRKLWREILSEVWP